MNDDEHERQPVGTQRIRGAHHVEMQVWRVGVAGVAERGDHLPGAELIAHLDLDAAGLEVGIERIVAVADVLHDVVAAVLLERQTGRDSAGYLLGQPVEDRDDGTVGHGVDVGAEPRDSSPAWSCRR